METIHYILDNWDYLLTLTLQHLSGGAGGWASHTHRRPSGDFDCPPQMAGDAGAGDCHHRADDTVHCAVWLMIPLFSLIGQGIGALPAITAVFLYSLLPIVRNTHTALDSLPPGLREAGRGIGMTFWQRLRWVEIPMHCR